MNTTELRQKSIGDLRTDLQALLREKFRLTIMCNTGQLAANHKLKQARRDVARIKTVIKELERDKAK